MSGNSLTSIMFISYGHGAHGHISLAIRMVILFLCISPGYLPQGHIYPALLIFTLNTDILIFNIPRVYNVLPYLLCAVISDILPGLIYFGRISRELCFWTYFVNNIFLDMSYDEFAWGCFMDIACMDMFTGKFRLGLSTRSYFMGKKIWTYFPDINFLDIFPDINVLDINF